MTKPEAWKILKKNNWRWEIVIDEPSKYFYQEVIPLYTEDQLHPRVKMTQAEFDELEISLINAQFDYSELKKTIEIVPDMKWFVQKKNFNGDYKFLNINAKDLSFNHTKDRAARFDTKEEAEKWCNPITEAVRLPVEENK